MVGEPTAAKIQAKVFSCPNCGAQVTVRAQGRSLSVACGSCGSLIDPTNETYKILSQYHVNANIVPSIELGTRAPFKGDTWEVIGFVIRSTAAIYKWREYLLYNPFKGFRWLVEYDGHWTFVTMTKDRPTRKSDAYMSYLGKDFKLFQSGESRVEYVLGEFYWRVTVGETTGYSDFIAPPSMLSAEGDKSEVVWSIGEYVEPEVVGQAFIKMTKGGSLPLRKGIGACQPYPAQELLSQFWNIGIAFAIILLLIHLKSSQRIFWNLLVCWGLALAPLIILALHRSSFEQNRWGEGSDTSSGFSLFGGDDD